MKKIFNFNAMALGGAITAWIVPMFVSFFMIDPVTMEYLPNETVFKITMILSSAVVTFLFFRKIKSRGILQAQVPHTFLLVNVVLDILILIGALAMPFTEWATTVFPMYIVVFYGGYLYLKR
jgi:hypothetical protein